MTDTTYGDNLFVRHATLNAAVDLTSIQLDEMERYGVDRNGSEYVAAISVGVGCMICDRNSMATW